LRQALRVSVDARAEDGPLLAAEFFLKVVRRVDGYEDTALLQRRDQLLVPDGARLYLLAVEEPNFIGRSRYLPSNVFAEVFVKLPDKPVQFIVLARVAEKKQVAHVMVNLSVKLWPSGPGNTPGTLGL
jgi:hypothetical protein